MKITHCTLTRLQILALIRLTSGYCDDCLLKQYTAYPAPADSRQVLEPCAMESDKAADGCSMNNARTSRDGEIRLDLTVSVVPAILSITHALLP